MKVCGQTTIGAEQRCGSTSLFSEEVSPCDTAAARSALTACSRTHRISASGACFPLIARSRGILSLPIFNRWLMWIHVDAAATRLVYCTVDSADATFHDQFAVAAARVWNSVPSGIASLSSLPVTSI